MHIITFACWASVDVVNSYTKEMWVVRGTPSFGPVPAPINGHPFYPVQWGHPLCSLSWGANYGLLFQSRRRWELVPQPRAVEITWTAPQTLELCSKLYSSCGFPQKSPVPGTQRPFERLEVCRDNRKTVLSLSASVITLQDQTLEASVFPQVVGHQDKKVT